MMLQPASGGGQRRQGSKPKRPVNDQELAKYGRVQIEVPVSPIAVLRRQIQDGTVCFDTTIPLYFAGRGIHGNLVQAFYGRAVTPWAVMDELAGLVRNPGVGVGATRLLAAGAMPRAIPSDKDLERDAAQARDLIRQLREQLGVARGVVIAPTADLGESAALAICRRYAVQPMAILAQDGLAKRAAAKYGIPILGAAHALLAICLAGYLKPEVAWVHYLDMSHQGLAHREFVPNPDGRRLFLATFAQMVALGDG